MITQNYFQKVITNENQFSQLLFNMLEINETVRKSFESFLFGDSKKEFENLNCQKRDGNGQPDFSINLKGGGFLILEVKTKDSNLTHNQPEGYIKLLNSRKSQKKCLYFLIPKYYQYEKEINSRYQTSEGTENIEFKILYWIDLINHLKPMLLDEKQNEEKLFPYIFKHLNDTFGFDNIPLNSKQIEHMNDTNIPNTILNLNLIVDDLLRSFNYKNYKADNKFDEGYGAGYGFIYRETIFVGYNFKIWADRNAPFIISIDINNPMTDQSFIDLFISFFNNHGKVQEFEKSTRFVDISFVLEQKNNVEEINKMILEFFIEVDSPKP